MKPEETVKKNPKRPPKRNFSALMMNKANEEEKKIEAFEGIKLVRFPDSGVAEAKPMRKFPEPAKVIDMTQEIAYEKQW